MKYYVIYVENSTPKLKEFKTKAAAEKFIKSYTKKYPVEFKEDGWWIDFFFKGTFYYKDDYYNV